jgi:molecular chaperone DnaJ
MSKDYYQILEVDRNSSADEIKKSYRKMAMKYHPDKNPGDSAAEEKFKECAEAFDVLSDPQKKQEYDTYGSVGGNFGGGGNPFGGFGMDDIFSRFGDIFGFGNMNSQRQNRRGNDLRIKVDVTIGDIIKGVDKTLRYTRQVKCNTCDGYGGRDLTNCGICQGTGQRRVVQQTPFGTIQQIINCSSCNGHGQITKTNCNNCRGQGTVPKEETVDIKIPSGAVGGVNLSMNQMGNWIKLGQPGDLIIHIEEKQDPLFKRENNNLVYDQYVSVVDAILGKEYKISTPHGEMNFSVQPGTEHGKVLRFQGKGVPDLNLRGAIGDLFIRMNIKIPQNISQDEREILSKLKESSNFN